MNKLVIPPPPNWYGNNILACAPDNTVIYASRNDLVVMNPKPPEEAADVQILSRCHRDRIVAVVVCPNWANPDKLAASIGEDKIVNLVDIATYKIKLAHSGHTTRTDKLVGVTFAGHDRVISVSENGFIVIWRWAINQLNSISDLLGSKVNVTCISSCPHASWLIAFGFKKGEILITDLRKTGRVLHKLRRHDTSIISLSWCPTPYNIFPKNKKLIFNKAETVTEDEFLTEIEKAVENAKIVIVIKDETETEENQSTVSKPDKEAPIDCNYTIDATSAENSVENAKIENICHTDQTEIEESQSTVPKPDKEALINCNYTNEATSAENSVENAKIEDICHKDQIETEESQSTVPKPDKEAAVDCNYTNEATSAENEVENAKTEDICHKDQTETEESQSTVPKPDEEAPIDCNYTSEATSTENSITVPEHKVENVIGVEKEEENKLESTKVKSTDKFLDIVFFKPITKTMDTINTLLQTPDISKTELITNESDTSGEVPDTCSTQNFIEKENVPVLKISENESQSIGTDEHKNTETASSVNKNNSNENQDLEEVNENLQNDLSKEFLLASSARGGRSIVIWRAGTDGIKQVELYLPGKSRGNQRSRHSEDKSWITLCWVTPKNLLSSSPKGELYQWNLATTSNTKGAYKWRLIHGDHYKHIFGIAAPIRIHESPDDEDWRERNLLNAWTVGKDRLVLNTSLCSERKTLALYLTISGSINCLAPSIIYPSKIAIGAGEGSCRLWDLSRPHLQYNVMTQFSDRSQNKVVSLAWHPTKETILAIGTTDGRIGIMDPCNSSKAATFFVQTTNTAVHRLDWGPCNGNHENFLLYAVTGGKLIGFDINKQLDAPTVFNVENVTQMLWKPDYSICAVATKNGHVSLFSPEMKLLTTLYLQHKTVRWITWHPQATVEDDGISPYANWLAVASNNITVYDCSLNDDLQCEYADRIVAVFNEHGKHVECLSWSIFEGGKLASAGEDGVVLVWDVKTKTLLHSCVMLNEVFTSVLWSPLDGDYLITGTKSSIIRIWKLSENPPQEIHFKKQNHRILKLKGDETPNTKEDLIEDMEEIEDTKRTKLNTRRYVLGGLIEGHNRNSLPDLLKDCKRLFEIHYGDAKNNDSTTENDKQLDILKVFGNDNNLDVVLDLEKKCNSKKKVSRASGHTSIWQGNTAKVIKECILTKTLNPWIISMAPTVSHDLYLEACEAYADHLSEDSPVNIYEAVSYYLACHKLEKAIDLLCVSKNYLEAVVLAKCRLVSTDPLITKIIERWANHSAITGNFEVAAQCYIVLHRLKEAATVLFKRTDEETLKFCAELAKHCNDQNFLEAVLFRLNEFPKEDEIPEVPLLSRVELELNKIKLDIKQEENKSGEDLFEKIDDIKEGNTVILGDGQHTNGTSEPNLVA